MNLLLKIVGAVALNVVASFLVDEIKSRLPKVRRWILERAANRMIGFERDRWIEEFHADMDAISGELSKTLFAFRCLFVAAFTRIELWRDEPDPLRRALVFVRDFGWMLALGGLLLLIGWCPPTLDRAAAYRVVIYLFGAVLVALNQSIRARIESMYGRFPYPAQVFIGGAAMPLFAALLVIWLSVPPSGKVREDVVKIAAPNPTVFYARPSDITGAARAVPIDRTIRQASLRLGVSLRGAVSRSAHKKAAALPGLERAPIAFDGQSAPAIGISTKPFDLWDIPGTVIPMQPLPDLERNPVPIAPTNVRIVRL